MVKKNRILAIGAHPDDIEFACLGYLLKAPVQSEKHIYVCSLGSVGDSTSLEKRAEESLNSLKTLEPNSIYIRKERGLFADQYETVSQHLTKTIETLQPDLILTHSHNDTHQEHRMVFDLTLTAARRARCSILSYGTVSNNLNFKPQLFVDISEVYEKKLKALEPFDSQKSKPYFEPSFIEIFHRSSFTELHKLGPCESFEVVRILE